MDAKTERQNNPDVETLASGAGNHLEHYMASGTRKCHLSFIKTEVEWDLSHKLSINLQYHLKVIRQFTFFIESFVSKKALPPNSSN